MKSQWSFLKKASILKNKKHIHSWTAISDDNETTVTTMNTAAAIASGAILKKPQ